MRFPLRLVVPVVLALVCAGLILAFLWWQLMVSARILNQSTGTGSNVPLQWTEQTQNNQLIDPRDRALVALREGDLFALRGEWSNAQKAYETAVEEDGGLPALRKLAQAQLQRRDLTGVRSTIRKLRSEGARSEDLLLLESIVELRSGELVKARNLLTEAEDSPQKHYGLALLAIIEGNHDASKQELTVVQSGWEPTLRSYARILQSAYDDYSLFPESKDIHLIALLSRALAQVQECELALPLLLQVTKVQDDYRDAWIVQGYCELTTERYKEALASLERAYSLDPQKPEIQYFLGRTYEALDDHANAITFLEYGLANGFEPASEVRRWIAQAALKNGDGTLALAQYEALTQDKDATFEVFEGYVTAAIALQKPNEALIIARQALERWPEDLRAQELVEMANKAISETTTTVD